MHIDEIRTLDIHIDNYFDSISHFINVYHAKYRHGFLFLFGMHFENTYFECANP